MNEIELCDALEALLFASTAPMKRSALRAAAKRWLAEEAALSSLSDDAGDATGDDEDAASDEPGAKAVLAAATSEPDPAQNEHVHGPTAAEGAQDGRQLAESAASPAPQGELDPGEHGSKTADDTPAAEPGPFALQPPSSAGEGDAPASAGARFERAFARLCERWAVRAGGGFRLAEVAEGYAFRSHPRFGPLLRREREGRPAKLSKPALEALAIVAYRQPVTKPEVDELRGVDSGGGLRALLERQLIVVVGKKDEPGRPLLYGTTPQFLDFFALKSLSELPSLREFEELHEENVERVGGLSEGELLALSRAAPRLSPMDAGAGEALMAAMAAMAELSQVHTAARDAFGAHGIALAQGDAELPATSADSASPAGASPRPEREDAPPQTVH